MSDQARCYNLLDEQWIPVLMHNGALTHLNLREVLLQARRVRTPAASNPMDRAALLRFLLAVLYWCKGNPPEDAAAQLTEDGFPAEWFAGKFAEHRDCFNLLGDGKRFLQYRVRGAKEDPLSINYLSHEVPTKSNVNHFRHAFDGLDGLCPTCCALDLLRLPMFATSGGSGKPPGVNAKPPVYAIPLGRSLVETLLLNWQPAVNLGDPLWLDPARGIPAAGPVPLLEGLTWVPRRVWLEAPGAPGACISCGTHGPLVRHMVFAPIGSSKPDDNGPGREWTDPHVLYAELKGGVRTSFHARDALGSTDAAADQWQRILAARVEHCRVNSSPQQDYVSIDCLWLVGFATVKNDKYLEALEWRLPAPSAAGDLAVAAETLSQWQKDYSRFSSAVGKAAGVIKDHKVPQVSTLLSNIKPQAEHTLSQQAERLAGAPPEEWRDAAAEAYAPLMHAVAHALAPGVSVADTRKRREVAGLAPQPQESPPAKPAKGKAPPGASESPSSDDGALPEEIADTETQSQSAEPGRQMNIRRTPRTGGQP